MGQRVALDLAVLYHLRHGRHLGYREIAAQVGTSLTTAWYGVKNAEKNYVHDSKFRARVDHLLAADGDLARHPLASAEALPADPGRLVGEAEAVADPTSLLFEDHYTYNAHTDTYITFLQSAPKPVVLSGDQHRAIARAYSNWNGTPASINEICRQFSLPRPWFLEYKRVHGWTHDKEPFSSEELIERPTLDLVEDALQQKRQVLFQEFEKEKWKRTQSDADKWNRFEQTVLLPFTEHVQQYAPSYQPTQLEIPAAEERFALVYAPYDLHYGKTCWQDETGESYDRRQARELLLRSTESLARRVARFGKPEKILVAVGSDWFHVDTPMATTTRGTPQDTDGSAARILIEGSELAVESIDMLRQIAPVEIFMADGNHDQMSSLSVFLYLRAWYRDLADVKVHLSPAPRQYTKYGSTLIMFTHGHDLKPQDLPGVMATEARLLWGETSNHVCFTGHFHSEVTREIGGVTQYQVGSLSAADRFHSRHGWVGSRRALSAFLVGYQDGVIGSLIAPVQKEMSFGVRMAHAR